MGAGLMFSSCTSSNTVFNSDAWVVNPYDITVLGVSGVLAKHPKTYGDFIKVGNTLNDLNSKDKINTEELKKYISAAILSSDNENKVLILSAFNVVFSYFEKQYGENLENKTEALEAVHSIANGIFYAIELYDISNGEVTNQMK